MRTKPKKTVSPNKPIITLQNSIKLMSKKHYSLSKAKDLRRDWETKLNRMLLIRKLFSLCKVWAEEGIKDSPKEATTNLLDQTHLLANRETLSSRTL